MDNKTITMPYSEYKELLNGAHNTTYEKFGKTEEEIKNIISKANAIEISFEEREKLYKAISDLTSENYKLKEHNRNLIKENTKFKSLKHKKWYQFWK